MTRRLDVQKTLTDALTHAGKVIRAGFSERRAISYKGPVSLLTETDRRAEKAILAVIRRRHPRDNILTEESGAQARNSVYTWIIDPLDGTTNYAHGIPHVAVSIGLRCGDAILAGGVFDPFREELFLGVRGKGATLNGRRIRVSSKTFLDKAVLLTGFPYDRREHAQLYGRPWTYLMARTQALRWYGAAALDLCWVACGRAEAFWEWRLQPWDCAAGWIIVEEAGGRVTDFAGRPYDLFGAQTLATNGRIHKTLVDVFKKTT